MRCVICNAVIPADATSHSCNAVVSPDRAMLRLVQGLIDASGEYLASGAGEMPVCELRDELMGAAAACLAASRRLSRVLGE